MSWKWWIKFYLRLIQWKFSLSFTEKKYSKFFDKFLENVDDGEDTKRILTNNETIFKVYHVESSWEKFEKFFIFLMFDLMSRLWLLFMLLRTWEKDKKNPQ